MSQRPGDTKVFFIAVAGLLVGVAAVTLMVFAGIDIAVAVLS